MTPMADALECMFSKTISAERSHVWRLLSDFTVVGLMEGFVATVEAEGNRIGDQRIMVLTPALGGCPIRERLLVCDEANGVFAYEISAFGDLPFASYRGEFTLQRSGSTATIVSYRAALVPFGVSREGAAAIVAGNFSAVVANLERLTSA